MTAKEKRILKQAIKYIKEYRRRFPPSVTIQRNFQEEEFIDAIDKFIKENDSL